MTSVWSDDIPRARIVDASYKNSCTDKVMWMDRVCDQLKPSG